MRNDQGGAFFKNKGCLWGIALLAIGALIGAASGCSSEPAGRSDNITELFISLDSAYNARVEEFLISEANQVAERLSLNESRPVVSSNKIALYITPQKIAAGLGMIGNITTSNYLYGAACDRKLSLIIRSFGGVRDGLNKYYATLKANYSVPREQADTNAAISLARQWLGGFGVNLKRLETETKVEARVWTPPDEIVPLYWVTWRNAGTSCVSVELFLPDKSLRQLVVNNSSLIERAQFSITNYANINKKFRN